MLIPPPVGPPVHTLAPSGAPAQHAGGAPSREQGPASSRQSFHLPPKPGAQSEVLVALQHFDARRRCGGVIRHRMHGHTWLPRARTRTAGSAARQS